MAVGKMIMNISLPKKLYYIIRPICNTNEKIIHTRELN